MKYVHKFSAKTNFGQKIIVATNWIISKSFMIHLITHSIPSGKQMLIFKFIQSIACDYPSEQLSSHDHQRQTENCKKKTPNKSKLKLQGGRIFLFHMIRLFIYWTKRCNENKNWRVFPLAQSYVDRRYWVLSWQQYFPIGRVVQEVQLHLTPQIRVHAFTRTRTVCDSFLKQSQSPSNHYNMKWWHVWLPCRLCIQRNDKTFRPMRWLSIFCISWKIKKFSYFDQVRSEGKSVWKM